MITKANTPDQYIDELPEARKPVMEKLRQIILQNLPEGFEETISYGMIGYVVPQSLYPKGYHADPKLPLPFINIASQKNHIALYHMGINSDKDLYSWFTGEYPKHTKARLDIGGSCIRFKNSDQIPYDLLGLLVRKMTPERWIRIYESASRSSPASK